MIHHLLNPQKFIPREYHKSFFDIDFLSLKKQGFKLIISDLDNTLISYDEHVPNKLLLNQFIALEELGFEIVLLSNNNQARMNKFLKDLHITGFAMARKPLLVGLKKALEHAQHSLDETLIIGDQLMTDIWAANRINAYSILVDPIKEKTEKWYTKINRNLERKMLKKIKRKFPKKYHTLTLNERT